MMQDPQKWPMLSLNTRRQKRERSGENGMQMMIQVIGIREWDKAIVYRIRTWTPSCKAAIAHEIKTRGQNEIEFGLDKWYNNITSRVPYQQIPSGTW